MRRTLKTATLNVNSIRARLAIVIDWLKKESPDVLCIQETKVIDGDFPVNSFRDIHYEAVFRGEKSYNGVAILSTKPLKNVRIGFDDLETEGSRLISATFESIPIINTYIPQGFHPLSKQFRAKIEWFKRLHDYINRYFRPDRPLLWMGDFNVAPEEADVYDPQRLLGQVGFHPEEHKALDEIRKWGFIDIFRKHQPEPGQYTFWDYRLKNAVQKSMGWRIDHIWATQPLARRSVNARIDMEPRLKERPSDHTCVVAEFKI